MLSRLLLYVSCKMCVRMCVQIRIDLCICSYNLYILHFTVAFTNKRIAALLFIDTQSCFVIFHVTIYGRPMSPPRVVYSPILVC